MTYDTGPDARDGHRRSMSETYLPRARRAGARVAAGHRVDRLVMDAGRATGALVTTADGRPGCVDAAHVIVCGGAIQSPALLQRSGLRHRVGHTLAVHPTVKLAARFPEALNVAEDVGVYQVKEFAPDLSFGGSASGPGLVALALSDAWERAGADIEDWRQLAVFYAAITSEGRGRVRAVPGLRDPLVTYHLTRRDREVMRRGLTRLALLLLEAGATAVHPSYRGAPAVRSRADLATVEATFTVARASVMTVHLCSTVPLGEDRNSATDSFGLVRGTTNVHVGDASLLPDAPGVNPQGSVMAFAIRNARHFVETTKRAH
jgi:choline dehydrogenase-like flavoprotein